jgi:RNA polymerase sigma factor (sigma-70 family)
MSDFFTTRWSIVIAAGGSAETREIALARLCEAYWQPLYDYVRRQGFDAAAAADLTQDFFAQLLGKNWLDGIEREGAKFRSFLLKSMQWVIADEKRRQVAQKRDYRRTQALQMDWSEAEDRYLHEPATLDVTPEQAFDRQWALTLLDRAMIRLRAETKVGGKEAWFDALCAFLSEEPVAGEYEGVAERFGVSRNAIASAVKRLRARYREIMRSEVAETLVDGNGVDEELHELFAALAGGRSG